jgi:hypothetical protein
MPRIRVFTLCCYSFSEQHKSHIPLIQQSWLSHYDISRKVTGFILEEVTGFFNLPNPSSRTMGPGVNSASNRNEYQESSWGWKAAGA